MITGIVKMGPTQSAAAKTVATRSAEANTGAMTERSIFETRFRAMGSEAHVLVVDGPDTLLDTAIARIEVLESRWSRLRETSEVRRLDDAEGRPCMISADTALLVERMIDGWEASGGAYDPTMSVEITALGYDRSFDTLADSRTGPTRSAVSNSRIGRAHEIAFDPYVPSVTLGPGFGLDPGGIGKGLAADIVTAELIEMGARGALVALGGDVRVRGDAPTPAGWCVAVEDPRDRSVTLAHVVMHDGAVCTSSTQRRRWTSADGEIRHHLLDPATGLSPRR